MRKIVTIAGLVIVAAIAIAWSTLERPKTAGKEAASGAAIAPAELMVKHGKLLPSEYWAHPF
jgi:hypothetical protein